ncbi:MAG: hypothetical protein ACJ74O_03130 [Frankiaceae bacterium]
MDVIEGGRGDGDPPRWSRWGGAVLRGRRRRAATAGAAALIAAGAVAAVLTAGGSDPSHQASSGALPVDTADASPFHPVPPAARPNGTALRVPPLRSLTAVLLPDGSFAYAARIGASEARVVDAVSPVRVGGLGVELDWCRRSGALVDPVSGSVFDRFGRWVSGPARRDLAYRMARMSPEGAILSVGARRQPADRSEGVTVARCAATELVTAQSVLRVAPSAVHGLRPAPRARLLSGVLAVSRDGELRLCDGFSGRSDCGSAGYPVAARPAVLTGGRYPWVAARECYGRLGRDGRLHDLVVIGSPRLRLAKGAEPLYVLAKRVAGHRLTADQVRLLTGDASNLAAAGDRAEVPVPDGRYVANPITRLGTYVLRPDTTYTLVSLRHEAFAHQVGYRRWARSVNGGPERLWLLKLDPIGRVRVVREQFVS